MKTRVVDFVGLRIAFDRALTDESSRTLRASIDGIKARARAITDVSGPEGFSERMQRRQDTLAAIERRLLIREILVARSSWRIAST